MTNTKNTPIEALERSYPMRVLRYRLRRGSGGAGEAPGGEGIERDLQVLEDCAVSLITERRVSRPPGLRGGSPGAPGENWLLPARTGCFRPATSRRPSASRTSARSAPALAMSSACSPRRRLGPTGEGRVPGLISTRS
jgi:N-methylhydantoinase B/oxoprolinase/acetone carboxylase alpha subunit